MLKSEKVDVIKKSFLGMIIAQLIRIFFGHIPEYSQIYTNLLYILLPQEWLFTNIDIESPWFQRMIEKVGDLNHLNSSSFFLISVPFLQEPILSPDHRDESEPPQPSGSGREASRRWARLKHSSDSAIGQIW